MNRPVFIAGVGMTPFGVLHDSITELSSKASLQALQDSGLVDARIDRLVVGCQNPDEFTGIGHLSTIMSDQLGLVPSGATRVETGPSSGASGFEVGCSFIASGLAESVLVIGAEKMSEVGRGIASKILAKMMSNENETRYGATPTALAALITRRYMHEHGLTRDELSLVPVKAHRNGAKNPLAHFQREVTIDEVNVSRIVADPLTLYDCSPMSDGAAAALLVSEKYIPKLPSKELIAKVLGVGHATDFHAIQHRDSITSFKATKVSADAAFKMAKCTVKDIDVFELHDAFSILELVNMEDIGLFPKGESINFVRDEITAVHGDTPVNPTGGLKSRGHPTGATGMAQIHDLVRQLRGTAPKGLQVQSARKGLAHNIGGLGNNMVVSILECFS